MGGSQTTTQRNDPWGPAQPYILEGLDAAQEMWNADPNQFVVEPWRGNAVAEEDPALAQSRNSQIWQTPYQANAAIDAQGTAAGIRNQAASNPFDPRFSQGLAGAFAPANDFFGGAGFNAPSNSGQTGGGYTPYSPMPAQPQWQPNPLGQPGWPQGATFDPPPRRDWTPTPGPPPNPSDPSPDPVGGGGGGGGGGFGAIGPGWLGGVEPPLTPSIGGGGIPPSWLPGGGGAVGGGVVGGGGGGGAVPPPWLGGGSPSPPVSQPQQPVSPAPPVSGPTLPPWLAGSPTPGGGSGGGSGNPAPPPWLSSASQPQRSSNAGPVSAFSLPGQSAPRGGASGQSAPRGGPPVSQPRFASRPAPQQNQQGLGSGDTQRAFNIGIDQRNADGFNRAIRQMTGDGYDQQLRNQLRSNVNEAVMPGMNATFANSGMTGSGLHQQNLAKGLASGMAGQEAQFLNRAQDRQLAAGTAAQGALEAARSRALGAGGLGLGQQDRNIDIGAQRQAQDLALRQMGLSAGGAAQNAGFQNRAQALGAAGMNPMLSQATYAPWQQQGQIGSDRTRNAQQQLAADIMAFQQQQAGPIDAVNNYLSLTSGLGGQFGSSTATSRNNPGLFGILGGLGQMLPFF